MIKLFPIQQQIIRISDDDLWGTFSYYLKLKYENHLYSLIGLPNKDKERKLKYLYECILNKIQQNHSCQL